MRWTPQRLFIAMSFPNGALVSKSGPFGPLFLLPNRRANIPRPPQMAFGIFFGRVRESENHLYRTFKWTVSCFAVRINYASCLFYKGGEGFFCCLIFIFFGFPSNAKVSFQKLRGHAVCGLTNWEKQVWLVAICFPARWSVGDWLQFRKIQPANSSTPALGEAEGGVRGGAGGEVIPDFPRQVKRRMPGFTLRIRARGYTGKDKRRQKGHPYPTSLTLLSPFPHPPPPFFHTPIIYIAFRPRFTIASWMHRHCFPFGLSLSCGIGATAAALTPRLPLSVPRAFSPSCE